MSTIRVEAKTDYLQSVSKDTPFKALAELIWNGFDADSSVVSVVLNENALGSLESIAILDKGNGMEHGRIKEFFGGLGGSWKKQAKKLGNTVLHGEKGRGRFKAFALGERVEWLTKYRDGQITLGFSVIGNANAISEMEVTELSLSSGDTGTTVVITNLVNEVDVLKSEEAKISLAKIFCLYLSKYPYKKLYLNGEIVSPDLAQKEITTYNLGDVVVCENKRADLKISIVEWLGKGDRVINFCDEMGFTLGEYKIGQRIHAPNCDFTIFAMSPFFHELSDAGILETSELTMDVGLIVDAIINKAREHFANKAIKERGKIVQSWIDEDIYPYPQVSGGDIIENVERQVFDILAVNVQSYLKRFDKADKKTKQFTFKLLKQTLKDNPESVRKIVTEVLNLKKEERDDLVALLERTTLSAVISASKTVVGRLDFIKALEQLLFDDVTRKKLLERDQLHKILEREAWIFREDFNLTGSEVNLNEVLVKHLDKLGKRSDDIDGDAVTRPDGRSGRVDLMLSKTRQPREGFLEHLVVELKRPNQKIDANVVAQIKNYAFTVAAEQRFDKSKTSWTFIAVSNELDTYAEQESRQNNRPKGLIHDAGNIKVWIHTWAEIINMAKARLSFFKQQLDYEAGRESATRYLIETHNKLIPVEVSGE